MNTAGSLLRFPHTARGQAFALLAVLLPAAIVASAVLAQTANAAEPVLSAVVTGVFAFAGGFLVLRSIANPLLYPHRRLGACNIVTLTRGVGILVMAGLIPASPTDLGWALPVLAAVLLSMDGLDGWLARRTGLQSAFGARLDVESDVAFALTTAGLAISLGHVGVWFILLGLLRPIFLAAAYIWPFLNAPLPEARRRKWIAGLQMAAQVGLLSPMAAHPFGALIGGLILLITLTSFLIDIFWLARNRGAIC